MGVMYYTLGQRRGLGIGGREDAKDTRWFVVDKDVAANTLYVEQGEDGGEPDALYSRALFSPAFHFISGTAPGDSFACSAKFRYRQSDQPVRVTMRDGGAYIEFEKRQRAVTPGQYAVLYTDGECLGGGVIDKVYF